MRLGYVSRLVAGRHVGSANALAGCKLECILDGVRPATVPFESRCTVCICRFVRGDALNRLTAPRLCKGVSRLVLLISSPCILDHLIVAQLLYLIGLA